jgi:hypothetical protein
VIQYVFIVGGDAPVGHGSGAHCDRVPVVLNRFRSKFRRAALGEPVFTAHQRDRSPWWDGVGDGGKQAH